MAHDDFMYTRQEEPREAFVSELQNKLHRMEKQASISPILQRIASIVAVASIMMTIFLTISPEARALVITSLGIDAWIAVSEDEAQDYFPFTVPQAIPEQYSRWIVWTDREGNQQEGDVLLSSIGDDFIVARILWTDAIRDCVIMLSLMENRNSLEQQQSSLAQYQGFAERYDWMSLFDIDGMTAVWRLKTSPGETPRMTIEWTSPENILHQLETSTDCMTEDAFIAIAQSSQ